jgi:hypothetical protein
VRPWKPLHRSGALPACGERLPICAGGSASTARQSLNSAYAAPARRPKPRSPPPRTSIMIENACAALPVGAAAIALGGAIG